MALWVIIALLVFVLFNLFQSAPTSGPQQQMPYSDFVAAVEQGQVSEVTIQGTTFPAGSRTIRPSGPTRRTTPT